ncbi:trypsin-like serine peptidase [Sphingomonas sp. IC4-52]|uniref:trypsin-like serine peptidase n=1 Tax=Sphingomonas sp. IC4-52 TaxID=2887202 RepID=UPI001D10911D|nr:trypsin-like peptidase domain-containing protein [Sphingomonas sp. IC4-52]MCC2978893.1 hypothetical protein [Sphingomonas sp. IC4-52]
MRRVGSRVCVGNLSHAESVDHGAITALERDRLKLERQKLALDVMQKRRELASSKKNPWQELISNPLTLAIVGGFISVMTTIVAGSLTAWASREAEKQKAELARASAQDELQAELIKKFTEGSRPVVRENLRFLIDAGLLPKYKEDIRAYLEANPDVAPQASFGYRGGIQGSDDAVELPELPATDPLAMMGRAVGQVQLGPGRTCTAFLIAPDRALSAGHCGTELKGKVAKFAINGRLLNASILRQQALGFYAGGYTIFALRGSTEGLTSLKLASAPARSGARLKLVMFRAANVPLAVQSPDCRVLAISTRTFTHGCDTGPGSSGAPLLSEDGKAVLGIHAGRNADGTGWATLASVVATGIAH